MRASATWLALGLVASLGACADVRGFGDVADGVYITCPTESGNTHAAVVWSPARCGNPEPLAPTLVCEQLVARGCSSSRPVAEEFEDALTIDVGPALDRDDRPVTGLGARTLCYAPSESWDDGWTRYAGEVSVVSDDGSTAVLSLDLVDDGHPQGTVSSFNPRIKGEVTVTRCDGASAAPPGDTDPAGDTDS